MALESILTKREDKVSKLDLMTLRDLLEHLRSTNESVVSQKSEFETVSGIKTMTYEQLHNEIAKRQEIVSQLVGNLHPAILNDEIELLQREIGNRSERDELN